jgi:cytochrome c peroxidase
MIRTGSLLLLVAAVVAGCRREDASQDDVPVNAPFALELPVGAPAMEVPAENPLTVAGVELGKKLFFDERLSRPVGTSCASCHLPDHAFSDTTGLSIGSTLLTGMRNSPTLGNVAFHRRLFRDGGVPNLEMQVLAPLHDEKEMDSNINEVAEALRDEPAYDQLSQRAYGRRLDPWVITRAIASYERTLISGWSRYDRFMNGDATALTAQEVEGLQLFNSAALNCVACHGGFDLSEHDFHNVGTAMDYGSDPGRQRITLLAADEGKFKVPTLRNVALTAPYMHDGSMTTLGEVIDHFASGGLPHPNRSELLQPFTLTTGEKAALIAFLRSLTDERSLDQVP